jgi:hypothetical protein
MNIHSIVKVIKNLWRLGVILAVCAIVLALAFWAMHKVNQNFKDKQFKTLFQSLAQKQGFSEELEDFKVRSLNFSMKVCESDCSEGLPTFNVEVKQPKIVRDGDIGSFILFKNAFPSLFPEGLESMTYAYKCVEGYLRKDNDDGSKSVFKSFYTFTYEYCLPKDEESNGNKLAGLCFTDRVMGNSTLFAGDCKTRFSGWLVQDK